MPFTCQRTVRSWSFLFQPSIRKQFLIILRPSRRHARSAHARQLVAVELPAAGISVVDIAFRVDCQMLLVLLFLSIRQHVLGEVASRERLTREALFGPGNATTDLLCADEWHVSSGPDKECDSGGCDDGDEGESGDPEAFGDAHCEKATFLFYYWKRDKFASWEFDIDIENEFWKNESSFYWTNMIDSHVGAHLRRYAKELHEEGEEEE